MSINQLSQKDIQALVLPHLTAKGKLYQKFQEVLARPAEGGEVVVSVTSAGKETVNTASKGDFLVQNQTTAREWYVVSPEKFQTRYEWIKNLENGLACYKPKGKVVAIKLTTTLMKKLQLPDPFRFEAPWGEEQVGYKGDYLVCPPDFSEVYRIGNKEFKETYELTRRLANY